MTKSTRELIDEKSTLSTARWSLVTCIKWSIVMAIIGILSEVVCHLLGKPLPNGFLGGCCAIIAVIVGIPTAGKTAQSFGELNNHYFDKYNSEKIEDIKEQ